MEPTNTQARSAGALYSLYILLHIVSDIFGPSKLIVPGNPSLTAQHILQTGFLYLAGELAVQMGLMTEALESDPATLSMLFFELREQSFMGAQLFYTAWLCPWVLEF